MKELAERARKIDGRLDVLEMFRDLFGMDHQEVAKDESEPAGSEMGHADQLDQADRLTPHDDVDDRLI